MLSSSFHFEDLHREVNDPKPMAFKFTASFEIILIARIKIEQAGRRELLELIDNAWRCVIIQLTNGVMQFSNDSIRNLRK